MTKESRWYRNSGVFSFTLFVPLHSFHFSVKNVHFLLTMKIKLKRTILNIKKYNCFHVLNVYCVSVTLAGILRALFLFFSLILKNRCKMEFFVLFVFLFCLWRRKYQWDWQMEASFYWVGWQWGNRVLSHRWLLFSTHWLGEEEPPTRLPFEYISIYAIAVNLGTMW